MRNERWFLPLAAIAVFGLAACGENGGNVDDRQAEDERAPAESPADNDERAADRDAEQLATERVTGEAVDAEAVSLAVEESPEHGQYLADSEGQAVYLYTADSEGQSNCRDRCADNWPPVTVASGQPQADAPEIDASKLGTIQRDDGSTQVTYDGHPLYYYVEDSGQGDTSGQGVNDEWYLVSVEGEPVEGEPQASARM